jgi:hypothetical protein
VAHTSSRDGIARHRWNPARRASVPRSIVLGSDRHGRRRNGRDIGRPVRRRMGRSAPRLRSAAEALSLIFDAGTSDTIVVTARQILTTVGKGGVGEAAFDFPATYLRVRVRNDGESRQRRAPGRSMHALIPNQRSRGAPEAAYDWRCRGQVERPWTPIQIFGHLSRATTRRLHCDRALARRQRPDPSRSPRGRRRRRPDTGTARR